MNKSMRGIAYPLISFFAAVVFAASPAMAQDHSLTTLFASDNNNDQGGAVHFDLENIGAVPLEIVSWDASIDIDLDSPDGRDESSGGGDIEGTEGASEVSVYYRVGTHVGNELSSAGWVLLGTTTVTAAGVDNPTPVPVGGLEINPGEVYGIAFVVSGGIKSFYTNGTGANQVYSGDGLMLTAGSATNVAFTADLNTPRVWNGTVYFNEAAEPRTTFEVNKTFNDGNTAEVEVTLSCNTGLPLEQSADISEGDGVTFVVVDFSDGEMDCTVTETAGADGYSVSYFDGTTTSDDGCTFEDVAFGSAFSCRIDNTLDQVEVEVTKVWIDENPQFNAQNVAGASWSCSNVAFPCELGIANGCDSGNLDFFGNPGVDAFSVFPDWEDGTTCSITEVNLLESGIEVDDSECQGLVVFPGAGASCTIFNTRLFEGIPTLSQYGVGILALLMLGVGFVAFRRVI